MLQMGSFRQYADADRLKASLALVGIQAEIQKVKIDNGEIFHWWAGPYSPDKVKLLARAERESDQQPDDKAEINSLPSLLFQRKPPGYWSTCFMGIGTAYRSIHTAL